MMSPTVEQSSKQIDDQELDEDIALDALKYLISAAWRDISLIMEVNIMKG